MIRIMTANIWGGYFGNPVEERANYLIKTVGEYSPDVIGFQEVTRAWNDSSAFKKLLAEYDTVGAEQSYAGNHVPLMVKKKYRILEKGFKRFADTPDGSKAISFAVLRDGDGNVFAVCNTHFWWMSGFESDEVKQNQHKWLGDIAYFTNEEHENVRASNARALVSVMKRLHEEYSCPVFAFGDMNCTTRSRVFTDVYKNSGVVHLFSAADEKDDICTLHADPVSDGKGGWHGNPPTKTQIDSIDHIVALGGGFRALRYRIVTDKSALDTSDHSPVYADIEI